MKMLNQCLESLVQKVHSGVVLNFEKVGPDPPLSNIDGKTSYIIISHSPSHNQHYEDAQSMSGIPRAESTYSGVVLNFEKVGPDPPLSNVDGKA